MAEKYKIYMEFGAFDDETMFYEEIGAFPVFTSEEKDLTDKLYTAIESIQESYDPDYLALLVKFIGRNPKTPCECDNCGEKQTIGDLNFRMKDLIAPHCPKCGAVIFLG